MKKPLRAALSLLLALCLLMGLLPVSALAAEGEGEEEYPFTYEINNGQVTILGEVGCPTEVFIPDTIEGYPVTEIGYTAFQNCYDLTQVRLPIHLKHIGAFAFSGNKFAQIELPEELESIGFRAFSGNAMLRSVTVPGKVSVLGNHAFSGCTALSEVILPEGMESIGQSTFYHCTSLQSIALPKGLKEIDWYAFEGSGLQEVALPEGVSVGDYAFAHCEQLKLVALPDGLESIARGTFLSTGLEAVVIPDSVAYIGRQAFGSCSELKAAYIKSNQVRIDETSFEDCAVLEEIYFYGAAPEQLSGLGEDVVLRYVEGQPGWTTPTWNGYQAYPFQPKLMLDEPLYNNGTEFHHLVYDYETGLPIQGARVVVDGSTEVYTNADGVAVIPADAVTMTITAEGYLPEAWPREEPSDPEAAALFAAKAKKKEHVTPMQKDQGKPTLTRITAVVSGASHDINTGYWGLNKQVPPAGGTFGIGYTVSGNYHTLKVEQGGKTVGTTKPPAIASGTLYGIKMEDLQADKPLSIVLCDKDGKELARKRLSSHLKIVDEAPPTTWSLSLGSGAKVTAPSDIPFFGGTELKLKFPSIPGSVTVNADSLRISVDSKVKSESWGTIKEAAANAAKIGNKGIKDALSPSFELEGQLEKHWGSSILTGTIKLALRMEAEAATQISVGAVPAILGVKVKGGVETELSPNANTADWKLDADLGLGLEGNVGIGIKDLASISLRGEASSNMKITAGADKQNAFRLKEWTLNGNLDVVGEVLIFEARKNLWKGTIYIIRDNPPVTSKSYTTQAELMAFLADENSYQVMGRDYLAGRSGWLADGDGEDQAQLMALTQSPVKVMQTGAYPGVAPQLVTAGELVMLVYEDDVADRDDFNRTRLMYSLYDAANNTWATPKAVTDDTVTAAQFSPVVREIDGEVYVLWQQAKTPIAAGDGIGEAGAKLELTLAHYDAASDTFTDVEPLTDNNVYELAHSLGVTSGGAPSVYWLENDQGDPFCETGQNSIYRAVKSGDVWTKELVAQSDRPISALRTGLVNGKETVAWIGETTVQTEDGPRDTATAFVRDMSGSAAQELDIAQSVYFIRVAGADALAWYDGAEVKYLTDFSADPAAAPTLAALDRAPQAILTGEDGRMSILYNGNHGEGAASNLYAMSYDPQTDVWGSPVALTNETQLYVEEISSRYVGQDLVTAFRRVSVDDQENSTASLCWLRSQEEAKLKLADARCVSETVALGQPAVIEATVRNVGTRASAGTETITLSGVGVDGPVTVPVLQGGEEVTLEISVTIPTTLYAGSNCELTLGDSSMTVPLTLADLEVDVEHYILGGRNVVVAIVTNVGWAPAEGRITLTRSGEDGQTGAPFRQLAPGESVESVLTVENDFFGEEEGAVVTVSVLSDAQQQFLGNDSATVVLHKVYGTLAFESLVCGRNGLEGVLFNASEESWTGTLILAAYGEDDKQLGCRVEDVTLESGKKLELNWSQAGAVRYRAFLLDRELRPYLCETAKTR